MENQVNVEQAQATISNVAEAVSQGAADAAQASNSIFNTVSNLATKGVYGVCYGISFGVTLTALTVARFIPTQNLFGRAVSDGAEAAKELLHRHDELEHAKVQEPAVSGEIQPA